MKTAALLALAQMAPPDYAPPTTTIDADAAAQLFADTCWRGLRRQSLFDAALAASPFGLSQVSSRSGELRYRAPSVEIHYRPNLCDFAVGVTSRAEAERLTARISARLGLRPPLFQRIADGVGNARGMVWYDVPVDDGVYRARGRLEQTILGNDGSYRVNIWLVFSHRAG